MSNNTLRRKLPTGNLVILGVFLLLLFSIFEGYSQIKGPYSESEIRSAQNGATRFTQGELSVQKGKLLSVDHFFFTGTVYKVQTAGVTKDLISFVTPATKPLPGKDVEWVGVDNYASSVSDILPGDKTMDGEIISLERISPKNNDFFYSVVHSYADDKVQRFIIDAKQLDTLKTLNSVHVTYRSPGESNVELAESKDKVAKGFIRDLWLTTKIKSLELERNFDFDKYPYYISVTPSSDAKYDWTFYLTKEQRAQVKLGNVVEVHYSSIYPDQIVVTSQTVDPNLITTERKNEDETP